jgi:hypothetical protein
LDEISYSLNASNSKRLILGITPFLFTVVKNPYSYENEFNFSFTMKIVDVKTGASISLFQDDFQFFLDRVYEINHASRQFEVGQTLIETKFYDMREAANDLYDFFDKSGTKVFAMAKSSVQLLPSYYKLIEKARDKAVDVQWFRLFLNVVDTYVEYQNKTKHINNPSDIVAYNWIIDDNKMEKAEHLHMLEIVNVFPDFIFQMMDFSIKLKNKN